MAKANPFVNDAELEPGQRPPTEVEPAEAFQGIPGTAEYKYITRMRSDLWQNLVGPDGWEIGKRPFSWTRDISKFFDTLRAGKEQDYVAREAKARGVVEDPMARAQIAREAESATKIEFIDIPRIAQVFNDYQERLSLITGDLPKTLLNVKNVSGAERYFLLEEGSFAENQAAIFAPLAAYGVKVDEIYYSTMYPTTHAAKNCLGWRIRIHDVDFVIFSQEGESKAMSPADVKKEMGDP